MIGSGYSADLCPHCGAPATMANEPLAHATHAVLVLSDTERTVLGILVAADPLVVSASGSLVRALLRPRPAVQHAAALIFRLPNDIRPALAAVIAAYFQFTDLKEENPDDCSE